MKPGYLKIKILDEVSMAIVGLRDDHLKELYDRYGIFASNYFFQPKFKLGQWDGKIRYFYKDGKTYLYLLEDILPRLIKYGYKVEIVDQREENVIVPGFVSADIFSNIIHPDTGQPIILRPDQLQGINALIEHGYGICIAGTGAGKTLMTAALSKAYGDHGIRSLVIVPDTTLIRQTKGQYIAVGLDTGEYSGDEKSLNHQHVISTWQALKNNPKVVNMFDMVIVDECQGLRGNVLSSLVTQHAAKMPYRFGFTGTLPKDESDKMAVRVAVGPVRSEIKAHELIDLKVLAKLHIDVLQLTEDLRAPYEEFCQQEAIGKPPTYTQFKDGYFPDYAAEKNYLQNKERRIEWIARYIDIKRDEKKGNVLCLVDNISFGRQLAEKIEGAIFVNGQDVKKASKRQEIYDMFKERDDLVVIATVHIAGTGLSINRIFNLLLVDIGKSFIRVIQAIGRGLRTASDKDSVWIGDISSDLKYGKRHMKVRTNYYEEAQYPYKKHKIDYLQQLQLVENALNDKV